MRGLWALLSIERSVDFVEVCPCACVRVSAPHSRASTQRAGQRVRRRVQTTLTAMSRK